MNDVQKAVVSKFAYMYVLLLLCSSCDRVSNKYRNLVLAAKAQKYDKQRHRDMKLALCNIITNFSTECHTATPQNTKIWWWQGRG